MKALREAGVVDTLRTRFREGAVREVLLREPWPVRDVEERLSDLRSQVASNALGVRLLSELVEEQGASVVEAYMHHVQDDAAAATRELLARLPAGTHRFEDQLDDGSRIVVAVTVSEERATFDFTGTAAFSSRRNLQIHSPTP